MRKAVSSLPNNTLTALEGFQVGHWTNHEAGTGCTVILVPRQTRASVVVRGGGPGARELQLLEPVRTVPYVDALLLTGGSAFGLAAADGVVRWLDEHGLGHATPWANVPIVPAAVIYDLATGKPEKPTAADGYSACKNATKEPVPQGNVGAGTGATVGKWSGLPRAMKGGLGSAVIRLSNGTTVASLAVVNAIGDVWERGTGQILAGARTAAGKGFQASTGWPYEYALPNHAGSSIENTTLCVVATDAEFSKTELNVLASMGHNGLARAVKPVNTPHDGDLVFALSSGSRRAELFTVGSAAADATQMAIENAVRSAQSAYGLTGLAG